MIADFSIKNKKPIMKGIVIFYMQCRILRVKSIFREKVTQTADRCNPRLAFCTSTIAIYSIMDLPYHLIQILLVNVSPSSKFP